MSEIADPGGRYAVQRIRHILARFDENAGGELARALNEGDAKGWRLVHMENTETIPGIYIVWDKQGAN